MQLSWGDLPFVLDWLLMFFKFLTGYVGARWRVSSQRGDQSAPLYCDLSSYPFDYCIAAIVTNVRRYVALAQSRGGACFCTRGAMQGYAVIT